LRLGTPGFRIITKTKGLVVISERLKTIDVLLLMLDQAFDRKSWHGTNLRGAIRGLSASDAAWRPTKNRHDSWEITVHAAYWKYTVRRRLLREKRGSFRLKGSNWFVRPIEGVDQDEQWQSDVHLLVETHRSLRTSVAGLEPSDLLKKAEGGKTSVVSLVSGVAAHDLYHAGQIQLLKRLQSESYGSAQF